MASQNQGGDVEGESAAGEFKLPGAANREEQIAPSATPAGSRQPLDNNGEAAPETEEELALKQGQSRAWQEHSEATASRYQKAGVKASIAATKLAIQKKAYMAQAGHEAVVLGAQQELARALNLHQQIRIGGAEFTSVQGGLWHLSSTKLWPLYKGADSWHYPGWAPGGHLRIWALWGMTFMHLDFGLCTYSTGAVKLPALASTTPVRYVATCDRRGVGVGFTITFLGAGHLKVRFPVVPLISQDIGCVPRFLPSLTVDLAAQFEGSTG